MKQQPTFSIIHASARPDAWPQAHQDWMSKARHPEAVEYILAVDKGGPFEGHVPSGPRAATDIKVWNVDVEVWNSGRKCYVDAHNAGCAAAKGKILILASDDIFPPQDWDVEILAAMREPALHSDEFIDSDFVIDVSSGTPADERRLMVLGILSKARYERLGYALCAEYENMYSDDDFSEHARQDGVVIDARHLTFQHRHPIYDKSVSWDPVYMNHNAPANYAKGKEILLRRRATRFGTTPAPVSTGKRVAMCLPGEIFSGRYLMALLGLLDDLRKLGYEPQALNCYSSDPGVTRDTMRQGLLQFTPKPDYVLWLDDDNTLDAGQFQKLMVDLDTFPELDAVFAWCWLKVDGFKLPAAVSCGRVTPAGRVNPFTPQEMSDQAKANNLIALGASGFPAVLMHYRLLEKAGPFPFSPILGDQHPNGKMGEDYSFCIHAIEQGCKLAVDPQVKIPHLKLGDYEPDLSKVLKVETMDAPHATEPTAQEANAAD